MARIRAVLFDIDGTLLDSNDAHAHAWLDALHGAGINVPYEQVRTRIGMGGDKFLPDLVGIDADSVEGRTISTHRGRILKAEYLTQIGPFHCARVLVDRLRSRGLTCVAVSSASKKDLDDLLRLAGVADLMHLAICADDAERSKPDPDLVEIALDRIGVLAEEALFIGDTPYDIEAARRAGVATIAFRCGGWADKDLDGAIAIYDDPEDLSSKLDTSPLALDRDSSPPSPRAARSRPSV